MRDQSDNTTSRTFVLHVAQLDSIPGISNGPPSLPSAISEHRAEVAHERHWIQPPKNKIINNK